MIKRIILSGLLVAVSAAAADAQNRTNRRRGALFGGLAGAAIGLAIGDKGDNETAGALIGGTVGAIAGGAIGDAQDQRINRSLRSNPAYQAQQPAYGYPSYQGHPHPFQGQAFHGQAFHGQSLPPTYRGAHPSRSQPHVNPYQHVAPEYPPSIAPPVQYQSLPEFTETQSGPVMQSLSTDDVVAMVRGGLSDSMVINQIRQRGFYQSLSVSDVISLHQQGVSEAVITAMQSPPAPSNQPSDPRDFRIDENAIDFGPTILAPTN